MQKCLSAHFTCTSWVAQIDSRCNGTQCSSNAYIQTKNKYSVLSLAISLTTNICAYIYTESSKVVKCHTTCTCLWVNTHCVTWNLEWKLSWMAACISLWKPCNWWQTFTYLLFHFSLPQTCSLSLSDKCTHTQTALNLTHMPSHEV